MSTVESTFKTYRGDELFVLKLQKRDWIVEGLIRERQSVLFVGNEKSGKSVFMKQLMCSLTSQHPFLDKFKISRPCKVTYVQLEGELEDTQDRLNRMTQAMEMNPSLFELMYLEPQHLQSPIEALRFANRFRNAMIPDVLIIDPIYFAFSGSLSDDEVVRNFLGNLRVIKNKLGCALILVHHSHKDRNTLMGQKIEEDDEATFGSKFLKAWADHIFLFRFDKRNETRLLSCRTQRGGDIEPMIRMKLVEPEPLYFQEVEMKATKSMAISVILSESQYAEGLTAKEITDKMEISESAFYSSVKGLLAEGIITKTDKMIRPVKYKFNREVKIEKESESVAG